MVFDVHEFCSVKKKFKRCPLLQSVRNGKFKPFLNCKLFSLGVDCLLSIFLVLELNMTRKEKAQPKLHIFFSIPVINIGLAYGLCESGRITNSWFGTYELPE